MRTRSGTTTTAGGLLVALVAVLATVVAVATPVRAADAPPTAPPTGSIGIRLLDAPVTAGDDPRARVYVVDHLNPGAVIERRMEVSNTTAEAEDVAVYAGAATIDGGSFVGASGDTPNDLTAWTSVDPGTSEIPAGGTLTATVTIAVPDDAAPGEQYGVVWAEARSDPDAGGGVTQISRVGIRLYISVGPGGAPPADFTIDALTAGRTPEGAPTVSATVHNTGGRALDMNGTLALTGGPGGLAAGPFPADLGRTLAIGDTQPVAVALDDRLPGGPWDAAITLRSGVVERTAQATITFPEDGVAPPVPTTSPDEGTSRVVPAAMALGAALVVGAGTLVLRRRRRRGRRPPPDGGGEDVGQERREPVLTP